MRRIGVTAIVIVILAGAATLYFWRTQVAREKAERTAAEEKAVDTEAMEALAAKYGALRDWETQAGIPAFDANDPLAVLRPLYSLDLQKALLDRGKPVLMVMSLEDVTKRGESYFARFTQPIGALLSDSLILELTCSEGQVSTLTQERPVGSGRYAIVASVKTLDRPEVTVSSDNGEVHIEASNSVFLGTGALVDFAYMGEVFGDVPGR